MIRRLALYDKDYISPVGARCWMKNARVKPTIEPPPPITLTTIQQQFLTIKHALNSLFAQFLFLAGFEPTMRCVSPGDDMQGALFTGPRGPERVVDDVRELG